MRKRSSLRDRRDLIETELVRLERLQIGRPDDQRIQAQLVALNDAGVRELLEEKLAAGHSLRELACARSREVPEHRHLLFQFEVAAGGFHLVKPSFLVVVDLVEEVVVAQVDPYVEPSDLSPTFEECVSASVTGDVALRDLERDGEAVSVTVEVRAQIEAGWPILETVRFQHSQRVRLTPGQSLTLVETDSGRAGVHFRGTGEVVLEATLAKWGLQKTWEKAIVLG